MEAAERGTSTPLLDEMLGKEVMDEITGRTGGVAAGPDMDYVTPEGMRFSGGELEQTAPGMAFSKGGSNKKDIDIISLTQGKGLLPTQFNINPERVQYYIDLLEEGKELDPIEIINIPGKGKFIIEGHHRYLASLQVGRPIEYYMIEAKGPIGAPNWMDVKWKDYHNEEQFWND